MAKYLESTYSMPNYSSRLEPQDIKRALTDFEYYMSNYMQIVGKDRKLHYFKPNAFQTYLYDNLIPLIKKETRLERNMKIVIIKPRQVGGTTGFLSFLDYVNSYLDDFANTSTLMTLPVTDTVSNLYTKKVAPIITGMHPDLMADKTKVRNGSSIRIHYEAIKGIRRNNYFEMVSANANSIRSDTINIAVFDECAFYNKPEVVSDAVLGSMPDYGFSLTIYMSTYEDRKNTFFKEKIEAAMNNPDEWKLLFAPWFILYPEVRTGIPLSSVSLTEYDTNVIIPEMKKFGVPEEYWGDCVSWYHTKQTSLANVKKEYPTTIKEVLESNEEDRVFSEDLLKGQEVNIEPKKYYSILTDTLTGKSHAELSDIETPLVIYRPPKYGRRYTISIDPIVAVGEDTDFFAASVFDDTELSQDAVFHARGYAHEDYADFMVSLAKIYNNATICPESNVGTTLVELIKNLGYYRFYYTSSNARAKKDVGVKTTVSTKNSMIESVILLLRNGNIIIRDEDTLAELRDYRKKVKVRSDGSTQVSMSASGRRHDDLVSTIFVYAATLDAGRIMGKKGSHSKIVFV